MRHPNLLLTAALLASLHTSAQEQFIYKREVANVPAEGWYSLLLPSDIFGKLNPAFGDLRLFEVERSDTVEIPYMLEIRSEESVRKEEALKLLNSGYHNGALVMTFEAKPGQKVNHLDLSFEEKDFFGFVTIEGSDRRDEWVLIAEDLRIVSLEQADGNLDLTAITFPATDHRYLRLRLRSDKKLKFKGARFSLQTTQPGVYNKLPATWNATVNEKVKHTYVHIRLDEQVPVEYLALKIDSARDYYRPFTLEYVRDSSQTDKGWIKHYSPLLRGHLTSYAQNKFRFPRQVAKELRLAILDRDNAPLNIRELTLLGPEVHVVTYLKPGKHVVLYGNRHLASPSYDLAHFQHKIPASIPELQLKIEQRLSADAIVSPLLKNKAWLWMAMALMIGVLGFFTLRMMKAPES